METTQTKQPGCNIFLIGFMGAGKSTIAAELETAASTGID